MGLTLVGFHISSLRSCIAFPKSSTLVPFVHSSQTLISMSNIYLAFVFLHVAWKTNWIHLNFFTANYCDKSAHLYIPAHTHTLTALICSRFTLTYKLTNLFTIITKARLCLSMLVSTISDRRVITALYLTQHSCERIEHQTELTSPKSN